MNSVIEKRKSFKSGFTKQLIAELSSIVFISIITIFIGLKIVNSPNISWYNNIAAGYIILFFGLGLAALTMLKYKGELKQYIVISPKGIIYQKGDIYFSEDWETVKIITDGTSHFILRSSDSDIKVNKKYFPKFDIILEILKMVKN